MNTNKINCFQCTHFAITWHPKFPNSCKLYGFKSEYLPSVVVYRTTGSACLGFKKKR